MSVFPSLVSLLKQQLAGLSIVAAPGYLASMRPEEPENMKKEWFRLECWGGKKRLSALFPLAALAQDLSRLSATVPTVGFGGAPWVTRFDKLRFRT